MWDKKSIFWMLVLILVALLISHFYNPGNPSKPAKPPVPETLSFSQLNQLLTTSPHSIQKITFINGSDEVVVERAGHQPVQVKVPDQGGKQYLVNKVMQAGVPTDTKDLPKHQPDFLDVLISFFISCFPIILLLVFFLWLSKRNSAGQTQQQIGRSGAQSESQREKKTFADVAGCDEAKAELTEVVDYLKHPEWYTQFGARIPKGVLLSGPPGTGKTLLARAVAGEADVPFFSIAASQFVELFVGVGAARVRDLFETARKNAPCLMFIDELDAVGRQRGTGIGGGHDEREQTLNQILVMMDGFDTNSGVIVMAATNRADVLDEALTRPGRFDRQILVDAPDLDGRQAIFGIHTKDKPLGSDVSLHHLAERTPGFTGADIEGACNEAATLAAREYKEKVMELRKNGNEQEVAKLPRVLTLANFDEGIDRVQMGVAKTSRAKTMSREDMKNTALHELGHALISSVVDGGDPVSKITIVPRARALGYTQSLPKGDRYGYTDKMLLARIMMAMGGRAAQVVCLGTVDTGASNDFQQATRIARKMVTEFGMSPLGPISVDDDSVGPFLGRSMAQQSGYSQAMAEEIDGAWRCIVNSCYHKTKHIIEKNRRFIEEVGEILLKKETILAPEWEELLARYSPEREAVASIVCEGPEVDDAAAAAGDVAESAAAPMAEAGAVPVAEAVTEPAAPVSEAGAAPVAEAVTEPVAPAAVAPDLTELQADSATNDR